MRKYKVWHTVDAGLGGYYEDEATRTIDNLLFGLYGEDGCFTSSAIRGSMMPPPRLLSCLRH